MQNSSTELAESKLLLLYIAKKINMPISNISLTELILSNNLLNYFALQQYIFELVSSDLLKNIEHNGKHMLEISDQGVNVLSMFSNRISQEKKDLLDDYLSKNIDNIKKQITVNADYTIDENNFFIVELSAYENGSALIDLKLSVGSKSQASDLCKRWKNNSSEIYVKIINTLIE